MADRFTKGWDDPFGRTKGKKMGTLYADMETGEGEVKINVLFDEESYLFQADVLQEWIGLLQREYDLALEKAFEFEDPDHGKVIKFPGRKA